MLRIGQVEATATQDGKYTDGSVAGGIAATRLRAAAFNAMQEELAHIVESAGLALDINDMTQVLKAIQKLTLSRANPFADIKSDGAAAISTALTNLGLGDASGYVGRLLKIQVFYNSGIYNPTPGTKKVIVEMVGGGGGSAGSRAAASGNISVGGAGGAGSYAKGQFTQNFSGVQITVGTKGAGGTSSGPYASDGGTSSFGSLITAAGGSAGQPAGPTNSFPFSTVAGVVSAGANGANIIGTPGQGTSASIAVSAAVVIESPGGSSQFGAGGFITAFNAKGVNGSGYGSGGGPSKVNGGNAAVAGGDGAPGLVIIWEYA
ncbi:carbohydrate kinase [Klebsiella pneumoniae]|uniref:carbohydrate kinase n=1 Tax=Klebsiella pneumoniae TaxID=573 RepID=UPI001D0F00A0|nr:carbohydrate kinase [Klebsiella pneumoniae]